MTQSDSFSVSRLGSADENGKLQEVYDLEKSVAGQDTRPDRAGDLRNMRTHIVAYTEKCERVTKIFMCTQIETRGSGKSRRHMGRCEGEGLG